MRYVAQGMKSRNNNSILRYVVNILIVRNEKLSLVARVLGNMFTY